jgi:hypothetical protein
VARGFAPIFAESIGRKKYGTQPIDIATTLKPFRHFLPERLRHPRRGKALLTALNEGTLEGAVTGASVIVIHSNSTNEERNAAIREFLDDIKNMDGEPDCRHRGGVRRLMRNGAQSPSERAPLILFRRAC